MRERFILDVLDVGDKAGTTSFEDFLETKIVALLSEKSLDDLGL